MATLQRFILPRYFKGAPNSSVRVELEIRPIRFRKSENIEHLGLCSLYMDSQFNPIADRIVEISDNGRHITIEQAKEICNSFGCIPVKEDFDFYNIEDLREIKHFFSQEWIDGFNLGQS